jgi:hypothetical protein
MKRCPNCHRFGIENGECLWSDCRYGSLCFTGKKFKKQRFSKFIKAIKEKKRIGG